ncbi:YhdP family phospholipid transporter [Robbsia andropogonis]|uniref:YhdP family phospholipid transporter n=1 Tax=Robbsia andropogonis TaxID=28092 RepID=UPI002A69EF6F|nr:AsmA-like C-terminal region-containing protein [Robbsia andropogonis]
MLDRRAPVAPSPSSAQSQDREHRAGAGNVVSAAAHDPSVTTSGTDAPILLERVEPRMGSGGHGGGDGPGDDQGDDARGRRTRYFDYSMRVLKRVLAVVTIIALIIYFVFGAVALTLRYVVMPNVDRFRPRVEAIASAALHTPVRIGHISAQWRGFKPSFTVTDLHIGNGDTPGAATAAASTSMVPATITLPAPTADADAYVDRVQATLAWRSLLRLQPILSQLVIDHARVNAVRDGTGRIMIAGIAIGQGDVRNPYALPSWLLGQREIVVQDLDLSWVDQAGPGHGAPPPPPLQLTHARLALINGGRYHRAGLQGNLVVDAEGCAQTPCTGAPRATMPIDLRASFQSAPFRAWLPGRAGRGNPRNWHGEVYMGATRLDLAALNDYVDNTIGARAGHADIRSWWQFDHGDVGRVHGAISARGLALQLRQGLPPLRIPTVDSQFAASQHDGDYRASVRNLALELDDQSSLPDGTTLGRMLNVSRFDGEYRTPRVGRGEKITLSGDVLDIGLLADFSRTLPLPRRLKRNIDRYDPSGVLSNYQLEWEREAPKDAAAASAARVQGDVPLRRYKLHATLDGVTLAAMPPRPGVNAAGHPHIGQPGFSNLRGVIDADQDGGTVTLDSKEATVTIRGMFDDPTLMFDTLSGAARWRIVPQGDAKRIDAHIDHLTVSNTDAAGQVQARFRALLDAAQDGYLDIDGKLDSANVPMVPRYLPTSITPSVRQYLTRMLKAGSTHGATIEAHGRLNDLPYPHGAYRIATSRAASTPPSEAGRTQATTAIDSPDDGAPPGGTSTFKVSAPFANASADISPPPSVRLSNGEPEKWPVFDGLGGHFFIDGRQLGFDVDSGHYRQVRIDTMQGRIPDLGDRKRDLHIEGRVRGPLSDFVDFVGHSPLGYWSNQLAAPAKAQGNATLALRIDVSRQQIEGATNTSTAIVAGAPRSTTATAPATPPDKQTTGNATASTDGAAGTTLARPEPVKASGTVRFERNRVIYGAAPPIDNLTGEVNFTNHTAVSRNLQGRFLGGDVRADGTMTADGGLNIQIRGRVAPERVATASDPRYASLLRHFSGTAPYQVQVRRTGHEPIRMTLRSDLAGLGIDLPAPLHKAPDSPMTVSMDWRTLGGTGARGSTEPLQRIDLVAGPVYAAYLRRASTTTPSAMTGMGGNAGTSGTIVAGAIGLGGLPALPEQGVLGELHVAQFDADAWRAVLAEVDLSGRTTTRRDFTPDPADASSSDANRPGDGWLPDHVDIAVDDLHLLSRHWHDVRLNGSRTSHKGWRANVDAREVKGEASWQPQGGSAVHARFSRLLIPAGDAATETGTATPAAQQQAARTTRVLATAPQAATHFPAIDLKADQFGFDGRPIGKLSLLAHNVATADDTLWQVDDLTLSHPAATLHASGDWRVDKSGDVAHTGVDFQLNLHDSGALLTALGMPDTVKGGKGTLDGALNWEGNPGTPDVRTLDGKLKLDLHRGQFLKVNPGAARLLGLLSLQGLVRFLQLDFKSVFGKGLAFNRLSGTTTVRKGVASTLDATLSTAPALFTMSGTANIIDETQDFHVTVVPHLNAVTASVAAAVLNPIIGLGTLVAQLALSEPISRSLTRHYLVQGTWDKPQVRRADGNRGNIAPTADAVATQQSAPAH